MTFTSRRAVLGGLAFAATGLAGSQTFAATKDGHAAGYVKEWAVWASYAIFSRCMDEHSKAISAIGFRPQRFSPP